MSNYSDSEFAENDNTPWFKVLSIIRTNSKVIDIGCSSGTFGAILQDKKSCIVDGVEINNEDRQSAAKKLRSVYDFNIEDGTPKELHDQYDYVYFGDVIEHLFKPVEALQNAKKLLTPNGVVIYSLPNMEHMSVRLDVLEGKFGYGRTGLLDATHLHYYTKKEITRVFTEAGYSIKKMDWIHRDIPTPILKMRFEKMGLKLSQKFINSSKKTEAAAYQYVGIASPVTGNIKSIALPKVSPATDDMEKYIKSVQDEYEQSVKRIKEHYENIIKDKQQVIDERIASSIVVHPRVKKTLKKITGRNVNNK